MTSASPRVILRRLITDLRSHVPGIRDGDPDSIHAARVATRRLREIMPLLAASHPQEGGVFEALIRSAGRALGRVRELDVMRGHLSRLEERFPETAVGVAVARRTLCARQVGARRKLIKSLERLRFDHGVARALPTAGQVASLRDRTIALADWARPLRERIGIHARTVRAAVEHASGVYFPNRAHAARIAVKRLRYSVELADETGLWRPPHLLRDLRKEQATLGDLHDTQVLLSRLDDLVPDGAITKHQRVLMTSALQSDIAVHHAAYLKKRERLRAICETCARFAGDAGNAARRGWTTPRPLLAVSAALVVPAGVLLMAARRARSSGGLIAWLRHFDRRPPTLRLAVPRQPLPVDRPRPR